eukprot:2706390-Pyramimonas_sp.AAC.1
MRVCVCANESWQGGGGALSRKNVQRILDLPCTEEAPTDPTEPPTEPTVPPTEPTVPPTEPTVPTDPT